MRLSHWLHCRWGPWKDDYNEMYQVSLQQHRRCSICNKVKSRPAR